MPRGRPPKRREALSERYSGDRLRSHWARLHHGDREPWPDERLIGLLAREHPELGSSAAGEGAAAAAQAVQDAWRAFHAGEFRRAIQLGSKLGALGACAANKAAAVHTLYAKESTPQLLGELEAAMARGEAAVKVLPDYPNAHYTLALVLGRYSQRISILRALAAGLATRVRAHLERALRLEPRHAEAQVAFGLYHAEIVAKLGTLAASLTYGASESAALEHLREAARLAPDSPIVHMEYAHGLLLLDPRGHLGQARTLYKRAAECEPQDAMERLDVEHARRGLGS